MSTMHGLRRIPRRHEFRLGTREIVLLGAAFVLIGGLSFVFGVLVGRELAGSPGTRVATGTASEPPAGSPIVAERRQPAATKKSERPASEDRLTFYRTLTAPTLEVPPPTPPKIEEHIVPHDAIPAPPVPPAASGRPPERPRPASKRTEPVPAPPVMRAVAPAEATVGSAPTTAVPTRPWTVQVSSFRSRALADDLRSRLQAKGFDAYLVRVATDEGRVWHRVRVGGYATRGEAERVAGELRSERDLNPVVTSRTR